MTQNRFYLIERLAYLIGERVLGLPKEPQVDRDVPFKGLNWFLDHCETISDHNLERAKALGGGIADLRRRQRLRGLTKDRVAER